jgi:UDP-glucose 4-epimerase
MGKVAVTGGAGFIGSHCADKLLSQGHTVCVVDNLTTGRRSNVPAAAQFVEADIAGHDFHKIFADFKPDSVIHAAASYKDPKDHWSDARTNVMGSVQVARLCREHDVRQTIYFQTALCYGLTPKSPVPITHDLSPFDTSYAMSKTAGERYLMLADIPLTIFRLAHICGPRNVSGPIPTFWRKIKNGEPCKITDSRRDFVHVGDLVEIVSKRLHAPFAPFRNIPNIYHVSSGSDWPILAIYHFVAEAVGKMDGKVELLAGGPDDAKTILLDAAETKRDFCWIPATKIKDSIAAAVKWYEENGVTDTYTHLRAAK